jgi:hypothetical protein
MFDDIIFEKKKGTLKGIGSQVEEASPEGQPCNMQCNRCKDPGCSARTESYDASLKPSMFDSLQKV